MAIEIKSIPVLKGESAERFISIISDNKCTIDFSKQNSIAAKILRKAELESIREGNLFRHTF